MKIPPSTKDRRGGLSSVVGAHEKPQPKIWKQFPGEEKVVNLDACKPHTVLPAAASDSSLFRHPDIGENLVSERYVVYLAA